MVLSSGGPYLWLPLSFGRELYMTLLTRRFSSAHHINELMMVAITAELSSLISRLHTLTRLCYYILYSLKAAEDTANYVSGYII